MAEKKITNAQREALKRIARHSYASIRFPTGEALRKLGLVDRETLLVVGRDYANKDGVHPQWRGEAYSQHDWYLTPSGRRALDEATHDR